MTNGYNLYLFWGKVISSGKANSGAIWAILWLMYIYKTLPLYSGFGFTSACPLAPLHQLLPASLPDQIQKTRLHCIR